MCRLGTEKVSFFSVLLALSRGEDNFVQEKLLFKRFLLYIETLGKHQEIPLEPPQYRQYPLTRHLDVFYIVAGISTPSFALV